jgi:hypothetical protein
METRKAKENITRNTRKNTNSIATLQNIPLAE